MRKFQLVKEAALASLVIMLLSFLIGFLPFKFEFTKGLRQGFLGFDVYDLYYSGRDLRSDTINKDIVIVQLGESREAIAEQLEIITKHQPKVIGVDVFFDTLKPPPNTDTLQNLRLQLIFRNNKNIVLANRLVLKGEELDTLANAFYSPEHNHVGYANFTAHNDFTVKRSFPPFLQINNRREEAFAVAVARIAYPDAHKKITDREKEDEIINYTTNIKNYLAITADELNELDSTDQLEGILKDKVVLVGYFEKEPVKLEDLHFTPLNQQSVGKSYPDMYGIVIHANIITMIVNGAYATVLSEFESYLIAYVIVFFMLWFILTLYKKWAHPNHALLLLVQLLAIIIWLYLFLVLFSISLIKIDLIPLIVGIVLSVEALAIYKSLARWLHKKFRYQTIFSKKAHL